MFHYRIRIAGYNRLPDGGLNALQLQASRTADTARDALLAAAADLTLSVRPVRLSWRAIIQARLTTSDYSKLHALGVEVASGEDSGFVIESVDLLKPLDGNPHD